MFNQIMVLPNIIALIAMSGVVIAASRGKDKEEPEKLKEQAQ